VKVRRDPACAICGKNPTLHALTDYENFCSKPKTNVSMHPYEVSVQEMKQALENPGLGVQVIDVRESDEYQMAHVEGTRLLPLSTLAQTFGELDPNQTYYLHCKMGGRSMKAVEFLRSQGFRSVKSVAGGIQAWSDQIDSRVPKY
jgi:adenylyltransferase/sulfurtransferase